MAKYSWMLQSGEFAQQIAYSGSNAEYIGECLPKNQARTGSPVWRIKKITYYGLDIVSVTWANGSADFAFAWDLRDTYTY